MKGQTVSVTEFKANCLAMLDNIGKHGGVITITKRGRPLATVRPAEELAWKSPEGMWAKKVTVVIDPLEFDTTDLWEVATRKDGDALEP